MKQIPAIVEVLRDAGKPLDIKEITRQLVLRTHWNSLLYNDVWSVLNKLSDDEQPLVTCVEPDPDYRFSKWEAINWLEGEE